VAIAAKNAVESVQKPKNLKFILGDGADLSNYFSDGEIERIFLNHSDPWPKKQARKKAFDLPNFFAFLQENSLPKGNFRIKNR
ncbi:hypothetical protein Q757_07980, partial [Oenococcus alcoholitolerans]